MPLINVKVIEGVFDAAQKREIVREADRGHGQHRGREHAPGDVAAYVEEVRSGDCGIGGNTLTTADVKNLAAGQPAAV